MKRNGMGNEMLGIISLAILGFGVLFLLGADFTAAAPAGPDNATVISSTRRDDSTTGIAIDAQAGNVTMLFINDTRTTSRWQGYFGNVTGKITLDDANSKTLYDWNLASPQGEIYASNTSTVTWTSIMCFNMSSVPGQQKVNLTQLETSLGMQATDRDGVNETFNYTLPSTFKVGSTTISPSSGCSATYLYVNDGPQTTDFVETILTDNTTTGNIVYTALLEQDTTGFTGATFDFQMLVGENGDVTSATPYYFFVELE